MPLIQRDNSALVVIDLQDNLLAHVPAAGAVVPQTIRLIRAARSLGIPILWTEHYPKGLGPTTSAVSEALADALPIEKVAFGCLGDHGFTDALDASQRRQLVLTGAETHVCVLQTALVAIERGLGVFIVRDAVASRNAEQYNAGLERMSRAGAQVVTAEMVVFEWLARAGTPEFKSLLPIIKELSREL